ncbi:hypothetical protein PO816_004262, partial [Cronobacter dublinensis]|nr:hypothetical protein [Cronobacter dublinensis]
MSNWRILKSKEDYDHAMDRFLQLADAELELNTDALDEFELLSLLIGHYEESHYRMDKPDPVEAIKFRMDQQGLTQADMTQYIGSASKVSEVLNRKRPLSLSMIRRLHNELGIPADILIQDVNKLEWAHLDLGDELVKSLDVSIQTCNSDAFSNSIAFNDLISNFNVIHTRQEIPNTSFEMK